MDLKLDDKVAIVTGASRGIGRAIAEQLADEGCDLAICARGSEALDQCAESLRKSGVRVFARTCDVGNAAALEAFLLAARDELGRVDALVNNASAMSFGAADEDWERSFRVDLLGSVHASNQVAAWMQESGGGSIVHISTTAALEAPSPIAYSALNAGLLSHAKNMAVALAAQNVRVNVVAPGCIEFPGGDWARARSEAPEVYQSMLATIPGGRMGTPEEVAVAVAFLVSPLASWINGAVLAVDGAQHKGNL